MLHLFLLLRGERSRNAVYSMYRMKGESFGKIYKIILSVLDGEKLLIRALEKLKEDEEWKGGLKGRNFINAFAKVYDEELFSGEKFGIFENYYNGREFEVCFNATEFRRGLSFRFQTEDLSIISGLAGNHYIKFDKRYLKFYKGIKLGDILAASSCFPGGFEPIMFPEDFTYSTGSEKLSASDLRRSLLVEDYDKTIKPLGDNESIGFMDGGVTDNQGLQSAMNADNLRRKHEDEIFDLIMVTDVGSYFMDPYENPKERYDQPWESKDVNDWLVKARKISLTLTLIFAGSVLIALARIIFILFFHGSVISYLLAGFFGCASVVSGMIVYLRKKSGLTRVLQRKFNWGNWLCNFIPSLKKFSAAVRESLVLFLKNTKLGLLKQIIIARERSVVTMVSDVNLKQVRRLIYDEFYQNPQWEGRRCSNFIYELSKENEASRQDILKGYVDQGKLKLDDFELLQASPAVIDMAEKARKFGTTLWFGPGQDMMLKELVSCGQFSSCCNLLQYVLMLENDSSLIFSEPVKGMMKGIKDKLMEDWKKFKVNPCFLYEKYESQPGNFTESYRNNT